MSTPNPDKSEPDVESDDKVASSRANDGEDGAYVGQTFSDDDFDAEETGAEARSQDG